MVFLDDDVELVKSYFEIADDILFDKSISVIGGKVLPFATTLPSWLPEKYYFLVSVFDEGDVTKKVKYLMGANFLVRKAVAERIGGFDIRLGRNGKNLAGGEEINFLNRAHFLKYSVYYIPNLIVYHKINEKLNENYVLTYSKELGKSERIIEESISKLIVVKKTIKSYVAILIYNLLGSYVQNDKKRNYLRIINQYAKGYIQ